MSWIKIWIINQYQTFVGVFINKSIAILIG
jgi:hypothetical protein